MAKDIVKEVAAVPSDCFRQEEVEKFHAFSGKVLTAVNYFIWFNPDNQSQRFLYCIELLFNIEESLLLIVDDCEDTLRLIDIADFVSQAELLRHQNGGAAVVQQADPSGIAPWNSVVGSLLLGIRLTPTENGLYSNDALLLDFVSGGIIIAVNDKGGLLVVGQ